MSSCLSTRSWLTRTRSAHSQARNRIDRRRPLMQRGVRRRPSTRSRPRRSQTCPVRTGSRARKRSCWHPVQNQSQLGGRCSFGGGRFVRRRGRGEGGVSSSSSRNVEEAEREREREGERPLRRPGRPVTLYRHAKTHTHTQLALIPTHTLHSKHTQNTHTQQAHSRRTCSIPEHARRAGAICRGGLGVGRQRRSVVAAGRARAAEEDAAPPSATTGAIDTVT